ncbi:BolA family protein [Castellaniella defragrans]|jgi:BolA protein|uniref:Cell division protein BolA n=2 Tax=Castellaniella defragrans TaxID=75697 RepID=W8WUY8_CASD6|nr:BolA family protein [Castellaniella defragrans]KAB0602476.1 BolA family transcriptional regulator [Castellaniella defragrans]MBB6084407.1 BolA protein [Castellaniella defragrans]CDM23518.1 Cell division protein BolA [Castellaniella defragrans 65Phen]
MTSAGPDLQAVLAERLAALEPARLELIDESHLHAGHAGARGGARHFRVRIVSKQFQGLGTLARHRLVYDCVRDLMPHPIHALAIEAGTPPIEGFS